MDTEAGTAKARQAMSLVYDLFEPEIILEEPGIQGRELREPFVIICNHTRRTWQNVLIKMDGAVVRYAFNNHRICSLMAKDIMENPLMRNTAEALDCIPVSRDGASTDWLHACTARLRKGDSVVIFPEGTTIKDTEFIDFRPGFALLASIARVRVLPVAINGDYRAFTRGRLKLTIGTPRALEAKAADRDAMLSECRRFRRITEDMYYAMPGSGERSSAGEKIINI